MKDLHQLPKVRDSLSHLYLEHCRIDRYQKSIAFHNAQGMTPIPAASLAVLMLGPGTNITQAAITALAENNCLVIWCGEQNVRFYAAGMGGTRGSSALLRQAWLVSDQGRRLEVVKRMYEIRFGEPVDRQLTVQQLRGREGLRVREAYARLSQETGVQWSGRSYNRGQWTATDPINRAISAANSCLYGVCHAAILSLGYSPALGFIHNGKQLSFVYDVADFYKIDLTMPVAFQAAAVPLPDLERRVRLLCRDIFHERKLLTRIVPDIQRALGGDEPAGDGSPLIDEDAALPTDLWDPEGAPVESEVGAEL